MLFLYFSCLETSEVILCVLCNYSTQSKQRHKVGESHKSVEDICDGPYCGNCHVGTDKYSCDVKYSVDHNSCHVLAAEVFKASFAVVVPAEDSCECEEYQAYHKDKGSCLAGEE